MRETLEGASRATRAKLSSVLTLTTAILSIGLVQPPQ